MGDVIYTATIPLDPRTKKNHQVIRYKKVKNKTTGRIEKIPFIAPSEQYTEYEMKAVWYLRPLCINFPVEIECRFYMKTKRRVDLTNLLEAVDDIMVKRKTIEDDSSNIIASHDGSRVYYDKENPRTEITIRRFYGNENN